MLLHLNDLQNIKKGTKGHTWLFILELQNLLNQQKCCHVGWFIRGLWPTDTYMYIYVVACVLPESLNVAFINSPA